jgi:peptidoglycan/LPS O-acetylase OafA/YrhL
MASDRHIPSLDGLRGISIALVLLAHVRGTRGMFAVPSSLFNHGQLGVTCFFVVSGFLITRLSVDEIDRTGGLSIKLFYIRRALRIFPAFYVYLAVVAVLSALGWLDLPFRNLAFAATYTMNYVLAGRWETGHLWSLAIEEQFYLIWPATIAVLGIRRALAAATALAILAPYALLALFLHGAGRYLLATQTFPFVFDALAAGCVLGGCLRTFVSNARFRRAIASPFGGLVPLALLFVDSIDHHSAAYHAAGQLAITLGICYSVARYTQVLDTRGARILAWRPLVWVGRRSYSLYLWQQLFLDPYQHTLLQVFPINVACAFACADASYRFIERPLNRRRGRYRPEASRAEPTERARDTLASPAASRI